MLLLAAREFGHILKPAPKSVEMKEGEGDGGRCKSVVVGHIKQTLAAIFVTFCDI